MVCERHVGATGVIPGSAYAIIDMHSLATSKGHNPRLLPPDKLVKVDSFIWIQCRSGWKPKSHLTVGDQVLKLDCSVTTTVLHYCEKVTMIRVKWKADTYTAAIQ